MWMAQSDLWLTLLAIVFGDLERGAILLLLVCDVLDITSNFPFAVPSRRELLGIVKIY